MRGPTIRRGTLADAALLSELGARTFTETFAADNTPEDMTEYVARSFSVAQQTSELADPASIFWLGVWERNGRAQAFYRKWNFRTVGEHVFQLGSDLQRDIVMERTL